MGIKLSSQVETDGGPAHRSELMSRSSSNATSLLMRNGVLEEGGEETSSKSAVEIVSRNSQKGEHLL